MVLPTDITIDNSSFHYYVRPQWLKSSSTCILVIDVVALYALHVSVHMKWTSVRQLCRLTITCRTGCSFFPLLLSGRFRERSWWRWQSILGTIHWKSMNFWSAVMEVHLFLPTALVNVILALTSAFSQLSSPQPIWTVPLDGIALQRVNLSTIRTISRSCLGWILKATSPTLCHFT